MKLTGSIHLIGSGRFGFALTEDHDCNVYLIDGGNELVLVDSGAGYERGALVAMVAASGFDPARVSTVLLTHKHADHSGGAADFQQSVGARVAASALTAAAVRDELAMNAGLDRARRVRAYPADYRFIGVPEVDVLRDGDCLRVGAMTITVVDTEGHCNGHLAYLLDDGITTSVFTGDALLPGGEIVIQATADLSIPASITALERLATLRFDSLMPGHGAPALRGGHRHARLALLEVARGGVPLAFRAPAYEAVSDAEAPEAQS